MIKNLFFIVLLFSQLFSKEYPEIYSQLANPLYSSTKTILKFSKINSLNKVCLEYAQHSNDVLNFAKSIDKTDKKKVGEYLKQLRDLQKEYDKTLYMLNATIENSIDKDEYQTFLALSDCSLEGLFKGRALLNKAIKYYEKNKAKQKNGCLEEKLEFLTLLKTSEEEIYNQSVRDSFNSSTKRSKNSKVYIEAKEFDKYIEISITNKHIYPITMQLNTWFDALKYDKNMANNIVVDAKTKVEYIKLYKTAQAYSYKISYNWIVGSKDAIHDDTYMYRLPYKTDTSKRVSQSFNGKHSHFGRNQYAIDFAMKIGTGIYAARDGVVVKTKSDSNIGGLGREFSSSGNYIKVLHKDGTFAIYYHLKQNGVYVKVGQKVRRGEKIATSGNTGNSSGPHLHFSVFKVKNAHTTQTIPIKFISQSGVIEQPKRGMYYRAK